MTSLLENLDNFQTKLKTSSIKELNDFCDECDQRMIKEINSENRQSFIDYIQNFRNQAEQQAKKLFQVELKK